VIATKGGATHTSNGGWAPNGRPDHLRQACEASLRRLKLDRIDLYQLHAVDPKVPIEDSVEALAELRADGKVRHVGLSNVSVDELARAREVVPVVSVQNRYNVADRTGEDMLEACEAEGIAFLPWRPLAPGSRLAEPGGPLARAAERHRAAPSQIALAWLLQRSPVMLPIPGTSSVEHLEENVAAATVQLSAEELDELARAV
jgi:aryl-alcohol dehydrogenase-like predicted oxidoreductase